MKSSVPRLPRLLAVLLLSVVVRGVSAAGGDGAPALRLPPDVTYDRAETSPGPVVFSHATHVALTEQRCVACHPALFSILQPARGLTHEAMDAGERCGSCHDGAKASGVQDACDHCHRLGGDR